MATRLNTRNFGTSLAFNGTSATIDLGSTISALSSACTFSAWFKLNAIGATRTIMAQSITGNARLVLMVSSTGFVSCGFYNGTSYLNPASSTQKITVGNWYHATFTWDGTTCLLYLNSVLQTGTTQPISQATTAIKIGTDSAGSAFFLGNIDSVRIFNRAVTSTEVSSIYFNGIIPSDSATSQLAYYGFDEGAGTTAVDSSASSPSHTGTITAATYSADIPIGNPQDVNKNLVKNPNFEFIPPFTAVGTTAGRWIDGTAAGSTTNDVFGWGQTIDAAGCNVSFDTTVFHSGKASIKVDCTTTLGRGRACQGNGDGGTGPSLTVSTLQKYGINLLPSTSYTMTYWIKTINALTGSHEVRLDEMDSSGTRKAQQIPTNVTGTNDWQQITKIFTTSSTTIWGVLSAEATLAGEIKTIWFDDISITPTTPTVRADVTNRFTVNDFGTAIRCVASDSAKTTGSAALQLNATYTISVWVKPDGVASGLQEILTSRSGENHWLVRRSASNAFQIFDWTGFNGSALTAPVLTDNKWHHLVATRNGTLLSFYIDSVLISSNNTLSGTIAYTNNTVVVGSTSAQNASFFRGNIDQIRLWNVALTAQQVADLYFRQIVSRTGIVGEWLCNEGSGSTLTDTSTSINNMTITGATYTTDVFMIPRTTL